MQNPLERILIGGGVVVVVALLGVLAWQAWEVRNRAQAEEIRGATAVAGLAPTWTAIAQPRATATLPPTSTTMPTAAPTAAPASATVRPASPTTAPTPVPATQPAAAAAAAPAATPGEEGRYLGRDPLPAGVDLTNGPFLQDLKARGARGASVGDGGLGDEIKAAYEAALHVERQALNNADDSQLRQHFTGEALDDLLRRIDRRKNETDRFTSIGVYVPRVMEFIPETTVPGAYEVIDARTITISTAERLPDGQPGKVTKAGEPARACYSVIMAKEDGRWKVQSQDVRQDGPKGHKCPPYWS